MYYLPRTARNENMLDTLILAYSIHAEVVIGMALRIFLRVFGKLTL
jgi:hypothetical protein